MVEFVECLESRRLLSTVTVAAAEASLAADGTNLGADATHAKSDVISAVKTFTANLKALHLKSGPLKSAANSARTKIQADISHIIHAGLKDGQAVFADVLHITVSDAGNAAKIAKDQTRLAADIAILQTLETPLVIKLAGDVDGAVTRVNGAVQSIVDANGANQAIQTDWATLSMVFQSTKQTLIPDLTNVISDLNALSTAT